MVGRTVNSPSKELADANSKESSEPEIKETVSAVDPSKVIKETDGSDKNELINAMTKQVPLSNDHVPSSTTEALEPDKEPANATKNLITLKVKDFVGVFGSTEAQLFVLPPETTLGELFIDVSCRFNIEIGDFELIYQDKSFSYTLSGFPEDHTFSSVGITPRRDKIYWLSLDVAQKSRKRKNRTLDSSTDSGATESHNTTFDIDTSFSSYLDLSSPKRDFVGLKNRNMTCYLNSFLQGLWFTPEFRNVVYNYVYEPGRFNKKSLCFPLQKLFLQQQFSIRDSIDTDDLIKTFGWEDRETWNQHDIEELCSIFMENLSVEFRGTPMEGLIQALYFGTLDDYVKCLECGKVSQRTDDFLVVPLPIKNFGSSVAHSTLEAALNSFVAYEVLDGNNMYNCGQCQKPCPAHKGFKFNRLPYVLTIQLKRFEYDFFKDRRFKLNDRVAFPFILDMNPYVENPSPDRREALKVDLLKPPSLKAGGERKTHSRPTIQLHDPDESDVKEDEGAVGGGDECANLNTQKLLEELVKAKGPEIYQLFGVMVHRGGINSGHYYAYILDFEREKWFRCDDAVIRQATIADVEGAYGGVTEDDRELTSAYMLLYRRFDPALNTLPYYLEEMPHHIQEIWKATAPIDQQLHDEEELAKNTVKMSCYFRDSTLDEQTEKVVQIPKTLSMAEAALFVFEEFFKKTVPPPSVNNVRMVRYDRDLEIIENSFEGCEDDQIITALRRRPQLTKNEGLLLEVKTEPDPFQIYKVDDLVFRTHMVDHLEQDVYSMKEVHVQPNALVEDLKTSIVRVFGSPRKKEEMWLVAHFLDKYCTLTDDKYPLSLFKFERINNLYVEFGNESGDVLLDFVEQYTKAELTQIYIQVPPNVEVQLSPIKVKEEEKKMMQPGCSSLTQTQREEKGRLIASPADTTEAKDPSVEMNKEKNGAARSLSNAASSGVSDSAASAAAEINKEKSGTDASVGESTSSALSREYFMKFSDKFKTEEVNVFGFTLRIDGQTPLYALSKRVSSLISTEESDFVFYKTDKTESTELRRMTERMATIKPFDRLYVKLEHRLQDGEFRVPVYMLNVGCLEKPLEFALEIVVTLNLSVDELRSILIEKCELLRNESGLDKSRIRIRKKLRSNPSKIMRENAKLKDLFTSSSIQIGELYVQILNKPCLLSEKTYSILYRHWHPSTGVLDSPAEICVFHDYSNDLEELILNKLKESIGVGEEVELEAAKPDGGYPWEISPRLIQDLGWFSLVPPAKKSLYVYSDELALFVRDKNEVTMDFDNLEAPRPNNILKSKASVEPAKRETGLKMNLSNSPSKQ